MKKSPLLVLFLTVFVDLLGFGIVMPFLPFYAKEYGARGWMAGAVVGVYSLMQFVFAPIWGRISDRIGRRPVLLVSLTGSATGYLIFAFGQTLAMLFLARVVAGIAAANIGTAQAYIADITTPENRAKGMGLIGAAFGLGFILGPPIGGILGSLGQRQGHHGNLYPGLLASALSATAVLIAIFALKESKSPDVKPRSGLPPQFDVRLWREVLAAHRPLLLILATMFTVVLAFASMETTVSFVGRDRFGLDQMGLAWIFLFMGVTVALIQGMGIGRLAKRFGENRLVIAGTLSLAGGLALVPLMSNKNYLFFAAFFVAAGQGLCYPSLTSLVTKWSPPSQHGSILGISSSVGSLSRILGPIMGGSLYDWGGTRGAFWVGAAIVITGFFVMTRMPVRSGAELRTQNSG